MLRIAIAAVLAGASSLGSVVRAETLERVVIVERHGIRAPSQPPEALAKYAEHEWPKWPVAPGDLTPHGALNLGLLGSWMRKHYAHLGLLPASGCPGPSDIFVWADGKDRRTGESGDALLSGLAPGCSFSSHHGAATMTDPLFDGAASGACKLDVGEATTSITNAMTQGLISPVQGYKEAMVHLEEMLGHSDRQGRCSSDKDNCFADRQNQLVVSPEMAKISGPLAQASMLSEALSLEYDEGMLPEKLGWAPLTLTDLEAIAALHNGYNDLTRKDPSVARHNGALMAQAISTALKGDPAFPGQGETGARLTVIFGHDTTLENMAGFFGLDWRLEKQPDNTPPGAALVFEKIRDDRNAAAFVRVSMIYQSADQLRKATAFDRLEAPMHIAVQPAFCRGPAEPSCTLDALFSAVSKNVPDACRRH